MNTILTFAWARRPQGRLLLFAASSMLACSGCRSPQQRIEHYLGGNANRPENVKQALRDGNRLVPGMTQQEVRLVLGTPARISRPQAESGATWHYDQPKRRDGTLQSSDMWTLPVPLQTVVFDPDNTVTEIISYDEHKNVDLAEPPKPESTIQPPSHQPAGPPPATASTMPSYRPEPNEVNVHGWPEITLQGLTGSGNARSAAINGAVHEPGDRIGPVRLEAIYANGVLLEYRGQRAFLRPGESTGSQGTGKPPTRNPVR